MVVAGVHQHSYIPCALGSSRIVVRICTAARYGRGGRFNGAGALR